MIKNKKNILMKNLEIYMMVNGKTNKEKVEELLLLNNQEIYKMVIGKLI